MRSPLRLGDLINFKRAPALSKGTDSLLPV
jgi:hypothetical protein